MKAISDMGHSVSRQNVSYWLIQYVCGYFKPGDPDNHVYISKEVSNRDIEIVQESLSLNSYHSAKYITRILRTMVPKFLHQVLE